MWRLINFTLRQEHEMGESFSTHEGDEKYI